MTSKKPCPPYDESIVEKLDYVPASHPRGEGCWVGGFFTSGSRNPHPYGSSDNGFDGSHVEVVGYEGLGALAAMSAGARCQQCRRLLPASSFSPSPRRKGGLRSRCNRCLERSKRK